MAIDTAERRRSVSQVITGLFGPAVTPNASKDREWRQQAGWGYSGIDLATGSERRVASALESVNDFDVDTQKTEFIADISITGFAVD